MKIQNLWALPRSYQNCASSTAVASPASCELQRKEQVEKRVKGSGIVQQPAPRCLSREELTTRTELTPTAAAPSGHPSQLQINRSCPATKHCDTVSVVSTAAKVPSARTTTNNTVSASVLYPNIFSLRIPTQAQQSPPSPTEELLPSSTDSTVTVISTASTTLCNSNVLAPSADIVGDKKNKPPSSSVVVTAEPPFLNCNNTREEEETKNAIGNSGCSVVASANIAAFVSPVSRKNQNTIQTTNSGSSRRLHRHSVFSSAHRNSSGTGDSFCSGATNSVSPPCSSQSYRSSSSSASTVLSIGPSCFAKLKRIVTSVRRSRSSSARMSVSGTKRKSSPPTFQSPTSSGRSLLSNEGSASGPGPLEDQDDSPSNPTKMRRRQTSQPSSRSLLTPSAASTITNCLSKSLESSTHSSTASSNAVVSGALPFHQLVSSSSSPQSKSRFIPTDVYSNNVHFFSRLRKSRKDSNSIVAAVPLNDVQRKEFELPFKLRVQLDQPPISHEAQLKHSWNDQDKSLNIVILPHTNSLIFRRYPVAQSTDCIRGKIGFSSGLHIWEIKWPVNQRGTHAVIGVATKDAPLHCSGYKSLIGSNGESWGWDIGRSKLMHDYTNNQPKVYPSHILDKDEIIIVPEKVTVILDMDEGTLAYMVDGQYLGVAFSGLKQSNKPLYPIVSAVWGHCEVEMTYLHASQALTMQSIARYQVRRYLRQLFYQLKHSLSSATVFDSNNQFGEINSNNNGNCTAGTTLPPSVTAALFNQITSSSSSAIDIVNSSSIHCGGASALPISACANMSNTNNSGGGGTLPNNPGDVTSPSGACTSSSSSTSGNASGSTQNNLSCSSSSSPADSCLNAAAAAAMSEHVSKKLFPPQSQQSVLASDLIQMVPLNTGINVPEWLFKSSSAAMGGVSAAVVSAQPCKDVNNSLPGFAIHPPQISVMSPLCSLSFTGLPPGCNTDSQFIEYHVERLQIPTCLKHYLI